MNLYFDYEQHKIEFDVIYRKRKTLSIKIEPPGMVTVIAPLDAKLEVILEIVKNKGNWIIDKLTEMKEKEYLKREHKYLSGEDFLYLGLDYTLEVIVNNRIKKDYIELCGDLLYMTIKEDNIGKIKAHLEEWYRRMALARISERIEYYQFSFDVKPNSIRVKDQKQRWGSCNSKRDLFFNWKIVMAPINVIDYVIVHEMCHMIHMNHSKDFWDLVEKILPDFKLRKEWLRKNGVMLNI